MKYTALSYIAFFIAVSFATILFLYLNKFLFILHGYSPSLMGETTVEAFAAYKVIYKSKLIFGIVGLLFSALSMFLSNKSGNNTVFFVSILLTIIFIVALVFYFFLPKRII